MLLTLKKTDKIDFRRYNRLRCSVPQPPKLYGLPKLHKPNIPMRPIVSFCGSPTYQLSKYLTNVLKPLTEESRHKLQSTENFIDAIKTIQIPDDHKLVSFDVKSLFTSIPLQLALDCTENAIKNSTAELPLQLTLTLKMTTAQVVETSVTVNDNSPIQDYVNPDDQTQPTFEMTPGFKPFTEYILLRFYITKL